MDREPSVQPAQAGNHAAVRTGHQGQNPAHRQAVLDKPGQVTAREVLRNRSVNRGKALCAAQASEQTGGQRGARGRRSLKGGKVHTAGCTRNEGDRRLIREQHHGTQVARSIEQLLPRNCCAPGRSAMFIVDFYD